MYVSDCKATRELQRRHGYDVTYVADASLAKSRSDTSDSSVIFIFYSSKTDRYIGNNYKADL